MIEDMDAGAGAEAGDGKVSRAEYLSAVLVDLGVVDREDVDGILATFDVLDKDGSGYLTEADLDQAAPGAR